MHVPQTTQAVATLTEVDRLNVCDPADEAAHRYRFESRLGNLRLLGAARIDQYGNGTRVADAGRAIIGSESFEVNAAPGRDLVIVLRTAQVVPVTVLRPGGSGGEPLQFVESELDVVADDRPAAHARFRPGRRVGRGHRAHPRRGPHEAPHAHRGDRPVRRLSLLVLPVK